MKLLSRHSSACSATVFSSEATTRIATSSARLQVSLVITLGYIRRPTAAEGRVTITGCYRARQRQPL